MRLVHLTSSRFFGGPERQMLGLADALRGRAETQFLSFAEGGRCGAFLAECHRRGHDADFLNFDTPRLAAAARELRGRLDGADVLLCHGYKADLLGQNAARRLGLPVVAVSRGWTGETWRVRFYEAIDRRMLRGMDLVVCVSEAQAVKVRAAGVPAAKVVVIRNAARPMAFPPPSDAGRSRLSAHAASPGDLLVVTAARLSPDKGIHVLIDAARRVVDRVPGARFIVFGEGAERERLERQIAECGLEEAVRLAGFSPGLDQLWPNADLMVLPSFTEGLPNVILEASAAGVPVVATAVGGTPEAVDPGQTGLLVPPGDPLALAGAVVELLIDPLRRRKLGLAGRRFVREGFTFGVQATQYLAMFARFGVRPVPSTGSAAA